MEDNTKINFIRPAFTSIFIALLFASFTQSCGVTQAKIVHYLAPVSTYKGKLNNDSPFLIKESVAPLNQFISHKPKDSNILVTKTNIIDTSALNQSYGFENQKISLNNQRKIIDLLVDKDNEVKKLRSIVDKLSAKTVITENQKVDAVSMETVWDLGKWGLTAGCVTIFLMIVQIVILLRKNKRDNKIQTVQ